MSIRLTRWGKRERETRTGETAQGEKRPLPYKISSPLTSYEGPDTRASDMLGYLTIFCISCLYLSIE